ncbi:hypothetical protein TWF128_007521 [Orbilia oligospora]|nr:hypothetical protein TWF128_007521 [Orbilia oligospora]
MVGDHSTIQTLNELGLETTELFSKIAWKFENDTSIDASIGTLLSAEADRFGLWAVSLGLFVPGHGSLDYRVREAENIRTVIKGFLETLNESLNETLEYFSPEPGNQSPDGSLNDSAVCLPDSDSEDEWWDESGHDGALDPEMVVDSIKDPIDRLYKLSTWIRNPSARFASSKILSHKQIDEDTGVDLLEEFNSFDFNYIESVFSQYRKSKAQDEYDSNNIVEPEEKPRSPRLSPHQVDNSISPTELSLIPRLAYANGRRRQQFSYWRRHREKLALHTNSIGDNYKRQNLASKEHNHIHKVFNETDQIKHPLSVTTATRLNIPQHMAMNDSLSIVSVSKYAPSNWSPDNEKLDFPAPPKCPEDQKFIECPYCFTLCPRSILETEAWKAHLIRDLRPYVCTYENCTTPNQLYDTRQDWLHHEGSIHRRVFLCPKHPHQYFLSLSDYQEHIFDGHLSSDGNVPINLIIQSNESTLTTPDRPCPICLAWIDDMGALQKHIALHLERFAIFSLPRDVHFTDDHETGSIDANVNWEGSRDENFDEDSLWSSRAGSSLIFSDQETDINGKGDFPGEKGIFIPNPQGMRKKLTLEEYRAMKRIGSGSYGDIKAINMNLDNTEEIELTASKSEHPGLSRPKLTGESTDEDLDVYAKHSQQNPAQFNGPGPKSPRGFKQTPFSPIFKPVSGDPKEKEEGDDGDDGDEEEDDVEEGEEHLAWDSEPTPSNPPSTVRNSVSVSDLPNVNTTSEIRCFCGYDSDDGFTIQCEKCLHWQHARCVNININNIPDIFICYYCEVRDLTQADIIRAREYQLKEIGGGPKKTQSQAKRGPGNDLEVSDYEGLSFSAEESEDISGQQGPKAGPIRPLWPHARELEQSKMRSLRTRRSEIFDEEFFKGEEHVDDALATPSYFPAWERGYTPPTGGKPGIFTCPKCNAIFTFKINMIRHVNSRACEGKTSANSKRPKPETIHPYTEPEFLFPFNEPDPLTPDNKLYSSILHNEPEPLFPYNEGSETIQAPEKDDKNYFVACCLFPGCTHVASSSKQSKARDSLYQHHQKEKHPDWARDTPRSQRSTTSAYPDKNLSANRDAWDESEYDVTYSNEPTTFRPITPLPDYTSFIESITITDLREVKHLFIYTAGTESIHFTLPIAHRAISYLDLKQSYFIWTAKQLTKSIRARATQLEEIIPSLTKAYLHETEEPKASSALLQRWTIKEVVSKALYQGRPKLKDLFSDFMNGVPARESCGVIAYGTGSDTLQALVKQAVKKCLQDGIDITLYFCPSVQTGSFITKKSWDRRPAHFFDTY